MFPGCRTACLTLLLLAGTRLATAGDYVIAPEAKKHWAWRTPVRPAVPNVQRPQWVKNPIDAFVLAKLEAAGLTPAAPAARETLLRRVTLDLIGLPPTPAEIDAFVKDTAPNAWEKVIDRLLASPHYGERWARHWLDLVRFAESNGYEFDEPRPQAWRYRDYVINAFNADKPFDRFVQEQLAGDELFPDDAQARIATGLHLLGPDMTDAASMTQRRQNALDDMTDTVGLAFLGLTVGCARCHDHKFEPIPQRDYYRLQAVFTPAQFRRDIVVADAAERKRHEAALNKYQALTRSLQDALTQLEGPYRKKLTDARFAKLSDETRAAHQTPPEKRTATQRELVEKSLRLLAVTPAQVAAALERRGQSEGQAMAGGVEEIRPVQAGAAGDRVGLAGEQCDAAENVPAQARRTEAPRCGSAAGLASGAVARPEGNARRGATAGGEQRPAHRPGEVADRPGPSTDGARHRQPAVAAPFRPRPGGERQ